MVSLHGAVVVVVVV